MPADDLYRACARAYCDAGRSHPSAVPHFEVFAASPRFRAAIDYAVRTGRDQAAEAIRTRAHEISRDDPEPLRRSRRRVLLAAANIAAGPMTLAEVAQALADGRAVWCNLDEAGRPVEPTAPAQTAVSGTTPPGEGDPVGAGGSGPQRAAQAVVDGDRQHGWDMIGYDEQMGWHIVRCRCGYTVKEHRSSRATQILNNHLADHAEDDRG